MFWEHCMSVHWFINGLWEIWKVNIQILCLVTKPEITLLILLSLMVKQLVHLWLWPVFQKPYVLRLCNCVFQFPNASLYCFFYFMSLFCHQQLHICLQFLLSLTQALREDRTSFQEPYETMKEIKRCEWHNPFKIKIFVFPTAVLLSLHSHEQPCASHLSAGLPAAGLLWSGSGLWCAGGLLWHAHSLLYGSRGENHGCHDGGNIWLG